MPERRFSTSKNVARRKRRPLPLEQYGLEELRVVGIVWQIHPPRAMLEDHRGMGYIVGVGMRIGPKDGRVKEILPDRIVVESIHTDQGGARLRRSISMWLIQPSSK